MPAGVQKFSGYKTSSGPTRFQERMFSQLYLVASEFDSNVKVLVGSKFKLGAGIEYSKDKEI